MRCAHTFRTCSPSSWQAKLSTYHKTWALSNYWVTIEYWVVFIIASSAVAFIAQQEHQVEGGKLEIATETLILNHISLSKNLFSYPSCQLNKKLHHRTLFLFLLLTISPFPSFLPFIHWFTLSGEHNWSILRSSPTFRRGKVPRSLHSTIIPLQSSEHAIISVRWFGALELLFHFLSSILFIHRVKEEQRGCPLQQDKEMPSLFIVL